MTNRPPGTKTRPISLKAATGYDIAICDINDINPAWCVASTLPKDRVRLLERSFDDNPLGQSDEQTPIGIWREAIGAFRNGDGSLGILANRQAWDSERRCLLLNAARISQH